MNHSDNLKTYEEQLKNLPFSLIMRYAALHLKHLEQHKNREKKNYNPEKKREYYKRKKAEKESASVQSKGLDQLLSPGLADLGGTSLADSVSSSSD